MPNVEERLTSLEGRVNEQSQMFAMMRDTLAGFERRVEARFDTIDRRFDAVDRRFEAMDRRFDAIDRRFDAVDGRFKAGEGRFETIEAKLSQHLLWTVGIQITVLVVVIGSLVAVLTR